MKPAQAGRGGVDPRPLLVAQPGRVEARGRGDVGELAAEGHDHAAAVVAPPFPRVPLEPRAHRVAKLRGIDRPRLLVSGVALIGGVLCVAALAGTATPPWRGRARSGTPGRAETAREPRLRTRSPCRDRGLGRSPRRTPRPAALRARRPRGAWRRRSR